MQKTKNIALILGVLVMSFLVGYLVFAQVWKEPTAPPPEENVPAPLNVSINAQAKEGALVIGSNIGPGTENPGITTALVVPSGNVGIGDITPVSLLTVGSGDLFQVDSSGNIVKIRNVTYSWPSAQGGANTFLRNDGTGVLSWASIPAGVTNAFAKIANSAGTVQFSATGEDTLRTVASGGLTVSYDATNKGINYSIADGGVTTVKIADLAVTNPKISEMDWVKLQNYPASAICPASQFVTQIADAITCAAPPAAGDGIPSGMIAMFDAACPAGWTRFTALDGRFPRGASAYGGTGGSSSHTHTLTPGSGSYSAVAVNIGSGSARFNISANNLRVPAQSADTVAHTPEYLNVIWCKKN